MRTAELCSRYRSPIQRLGGVIWGNHDPAHCWLAMLTYYDASGTQKDKGGALVVVGLASTENKWRRFEREWNALLGEYGVSVFHMTAYTHSTDDFESWKGDGERRAQFLERALKITKRNTHKLFVVGVMMDGYRAVDRDYTLSEAWGSNQPDAGAFALAAHHCRAMVEEWIRKRHPGRAIHHVFEAGDRGRGAFEAGLVKWDQRAAAGVTFLPKVDPMTGQRVRPFECVDLIAWEYRNLYTAYDSTGGFPQRRSLHEIAKLIPTEEGYFTEDMLRAMCENANMPNVLHRRQS